MRNAYGSRVQIGALIHCLNGFPANRDSPAGRASKTGLWSGLGEWVRRQPRGAAVIYFLESGLSIGDEEERLEAFVTECEKVWGEPVTALPQSTAIPFKLFRAQKALALTRFRRTPAEVTEGFVVAAGSIDGEDIAERTLFWQRWAPIGKPSGTTVVVSPGFQETGRSFYEQIHLLAKSGHAAVVMDHQWAGYSSGSKGGVDRGFGIARDVATVTAMVREQAEAGQIVLLGNSMGAGPGVLGALVLNDAGRIQLQGPPMPKGLNAILQAPYLESSPGLCNRALAMFARAGSLSQIPIPALGIPKLTQDPVAAAQFAHHVAEEGVVVRAQAMDATAADLEVILKAVSSHVPAGKVFIVHGDQDPLANPAAVKRLASLLGHRARLLLIQSRNHILEESPSEQQHFLQGLP